MESSVQGRLAGWEIHGFRSMEDLEVPKIMEEATTRWLRPNEIHAILCNHSYFNVSVKPVNLPKSGTITLFDRKMLRNFRKDGHNWKKKKDGKTVKEAHEHLKVGNEERIHVYYAHGQDNPNFVRRCYWLLDKKQEHIVLVHYRETVELQGSPVTPVNSNSGSSYSNPSASRGSSEDTDSVAHLGFYAGDDLFPTNESRELGDSINVIDHERRLHEINTLEWEDLVATHDHNSTVRKSDISQCIEQPGQHRISASKTNDSLFTTNNSAEVIHPFGHPSNMTVNSGSDVRLSDSVHFQTNGDQFKSNIQRKDMEIGHTDESLDIYVKDNLQTQDSFGRWMNYIMTDSPESLDGTSLGSPISSGQEASAFPTLNHHQSSIQAQIFTITDVSPAWAFSTEETKVIVIGFFNEEHLYFAESKLVFIFGDVCVPAEKVQLGVFRCLALPHPPGLINFYLSFDGSTPISQVLTFEYRSPSIDNLVPLPENKMKSEEFQFFMRLMHLLFSTSRSLNILSSKVSPNALKEAKKFANATCFIDKDWSCLMKTIQNNEISFRHATNVLLELTLKNKLRDWLLERVVEGCKSTDRDHQGLGVIHLCAILGYTWAIDLFSSSGLSLDFRDAKGWTALHWAAYHGREEMVAVLLTSGAKPNYVTDPTPENPGGCTAADIASKNGYDGLSAFLAEKALIAQFEEMYLAGNASGSLLNVKDELANPANLSEEELSLKDSLAAYRMAADAAAHIQAAFREQSFKMKSKEIQSAEPEIEARNIIAAMKIQHAFRNHATRKRMSAAVRIQHGFRTWKTRKAFLNMRKHAIKIQAVFRGFQLRRQYRKILWSVGVLEKAILRWRQKRKGFRGLQVEPVEAVAVDQENDVEDFFHVGRKQAEDRVERAVVRVQAMFRSKQAQQEYRRMKLALDQAMLEHRFL